MILPKPYCAFYHVQLGHKLDGPPVNRVSHAVHACSINGNGQVDVAMAGQVFTKAWSAALLNALGDVLAQLVVDKNEKLDWKRLGIFTILVLFRWT